MQLLKYSEAVGLPVVCADNGKKAGLIKDVICIPSERVVSAFLLDRKGTEIGRKQILFINVLRIGRDALVIESENAITSLSKGSKNAEALEDEHIIGLHVFESQAVK